MILTLNEAAEVLTDLQLCDDVTQDDPESDELGTIPNPPTTKEIHMNGSLSFRDEAFIAIYVALLNLNPEENALSLSRRTEQHVEFLDRARKNARRNRLQLDLLNDDDPDGIDELLEAL